MTICKNLVSKSQERYLYSLRILLMSFTNYLSVIRDATNFTKSGKHYNATKTR